MQPATLLLLAGAAHGFYLPGVAPREYATGEKVDVKVNKLTSTKTQVRPGKSAQQPGSELWLRCCGAPCRRLQPRAAPRAGRARERRRFWPLWHRAAAQPPLRRQAH